jgi:hypothetical protein
VLVKARSRRLLPTTKTLENAIVVAANIGLSTGFAPLVDAVGVIEQGACCGLDGSNQQ